MTANESIDHADAEGLEGTATEPTEPDELAKLREELDKVKAQSRKWEQRAKSNADKAKEYDRIAGESLSTEEQLQAAKDAAAAAEAKLAQYEADAQYAKDAAEVAEQYSVPASLLTERDRAQMELQAQAIRAFADGRPSAPVIAQDGRKPAGKGSKNPKASFKTWLDQNPI